MKFYEASQYLCEFIKNILPNCEVFEIANQKIELTQKTPFIAVIADVGAMETNHVFYECPFYIIAGVSNPDPIVARNQAFDLLVTIYKNLPESNLISVKRKTSPFEYIAYHSNLTLMSLEVYAIVEL